MIKFLPSFVGSKAHWVPHIKKLISTKEDIIEPFCGSAVLSANLAKTTTLVDLDPYVCQILSKFDELIVPEIFTQENYFQCREKEDWWKYAFCLQKMSFSGVFRHSDNGYNVPVKKNIASVSLQEEYKTALRVWKKLNPTVINDSFLNLDLNLFVNKMIILDPPYEGSQASYNVGFNYHDYWKWVSEIIPLAKYVFLFDRSTNIERKLKISQIRYLNQKKLRVNGKYDGDVETLVLLKTYK